MTPDAERIAAKLRQQIERWSDPALAPQGLAVTGQPFVVATEDGSLALHLDRDRAVPVATTPGLSGVSHMTLRDAERVAEIRGDGFQAVAVADFPDHRLRSLRATLGALLAHQVWRQKHPDFRSSPGDETHPSILLHVEGRGTCLQPLSGLSLERLEELLAEGDGFVDGRWTRGSAA